MLEKFTKDIGASGLAQNSHGMEPNFVPGDYYSTDSKNNIKKIY
jgi:hypothetical protein